MKLEFTLLPFFLFLIEQMVMIKLGSYPYLWGFPFARKTLPDNMQIEDVGGFVGRLRIGKDKEGNTFFRYKHSAPSPNLARSSAQQGAPPDAPNVAPVSLVVM